MRKFTFLFIGAAVAAPAAVAQPVMTLPTGAKRSTCYAFALGNGWAAEPKSGLPSSPFVEDPSQPPPNTTNSVDTFTYATDEDNPCWGRGEFAAVAKPKGKAFVNWAVSNGKADYEAKIETTGASSIFVGAQADDVGSCEATLANGGCAWYDLGAIGGPGGPGIWDDVGKHPVDSAWAIANANAIVAIDRKARVETTSKVSIYNVSSGSGKATAEANGSHAPGVIAHVASGYRYPSGAQVACSWAYYDEDAELISDSVLVASATIDHSVVAYAWYEDAVTIDDDHEDQPRASASGNVTGSNNASSGHLTQAQLWIKAEDI